MSESNSAETKRSPNLLEQVFQKQPLITGSLFALGTATFALKSFKGIKYLWSVNFFRPTNLDLLQKRYGQNSWVVVTGATDGLGKAFALRLAQADFNLVLLGRSETKMAKVVEEIQSQGHKINCETVIFDLKNSAQADQLNALLDKALENKDVSMLINNAGISSTEFHEEVPNQEILDMININCLAPSLISKKILPLLKQRSLKSAMINVSSFTGVHPMPFTAVYSGTKAFLDAFSKSVAIENREKIDVISLTPFYVSTKMIKYQKQDFETRSPEDVIEACFRDLGSRDRTFGHISHELIHAYSAIMPEKYVENFRKTRMLEVVNKIRAIKEAMAKRSRKKENK